MQKNLEDENKQLAAAEEAIQGFIAEAEKLAESVKVAKEAANEAKAAVKGQKDALAGTVTRDSLIRKVARKISL